MRHNVYLELLWISHEKNAIFIQTTNDIWIENSSLGKEDPYKSIQTVQWRKEIYRAKRMLIIINGLWDIVIANSLNSLNYKTLTSLAAGSIKGFATVKKKKVCYGWRWFRTGQVGLGIDHHPGVWLVEYPAITYPMKNRTTATSTRAKQVRTELEMPFLFLIPHRNY